jgi:hypothetical protein
MIDEREFDPNEECRCPSCGEAKIRADFHYRMNSPDGMASSCKACVSEYQKIRRERVKADRESSLVKELRAEIARLTTLTEHYADVLSEIRKMQTMEISGEETP